MASPGKVRHRGCVDGGKVRGGITVPSTSCRTGLDMAVVDINKNFLYYLVRAAFWEVDSM